VARVLRILALMESAGFLVTREKFLGKMAGNGIEGQTVVGRKGGVDFVFSNPELLKKGNGFERVVLTDEFFVVFGIDGLGGLDDDLFFSQLLEEGFNLSGSNQGAETGTDSIGQGNGAGDGLVFVTGVSGTVVKTVFIELGDDVNLLGVDNVVADTKIN